ncbi:S-layer homology domain-containing protein [Effusibacillus consociatus]|uniref:S-layer homology domain-containing protein n=1 Tax=Effusibacillus consociatus TaxID=1117041 RepID=A0ABV9Q594_9BACL
MVVMISNVLGSKNVPMKTTTSDSADFNDHSRISSWAKEAADKAVRVGIVKGKPDGDGVKFAPQDNATRAEAVVMLRKLFGVLN